MKKAYIQPDTQIVTISTAKAWLGNDPGIYGDGASQQRVATAMDANENSFNESDNWEISSPNLWDE